MTKVSIEEAQAKLKELIHSLPPGEEVIITEDDQAVARLTAAAPAKPPRLGTLRGTVTYRPFRPIIAIPLTGCL